MCRLNQPCNALHVGVFAKCFYIHGTCRPIKQKQARTHELSEQCMPEQAQAHEGKARAKSRSGPTSSSNRFRSSARLNKCGPTKQKQARAHELIRAHEVVLQISASALPVLEMRGQAWAHEIILRISMLGCRGKHRPRKQKRLQAQEPLLAHEVVLRISFRGPSKEKQH